MKTNYLVPQTYKIMIVDDEDMIRLLTKANLEEYKYQVIDFASPSATLKYYKENYRQIDLVILDMLMPLMNGDILFLKLKQINPHLVACVLSGYDGVEVEYHHLLDNGLYCFLKKPIQGEEISLKVQEMLSASQTINIDKGLSLIMRNEGIYLKLLKVYHEEYCNLEQMFRHLQEEEKFLEIDNIIHKIKGIAMNLGAETCYQMASVLHAKYHHQEIDLMGIDAFIKYHNYVLKDIERILGVQSV